METTPQAPVTETPAPAEDKAPIDPKPETIEKPEGEPKPETPAKPKHKIKANGKELELDLDEIIKRAELAEGADAKLREAKQLRDQNKKAIEKMERLTKGDGDLVSELMDVIGLDRLVEISGQVSSQQQIWNQMTDAERAELLERHEAEEAKRELAEHKKQKADQEAIAARNQAFDVIESEISEALAEARDQGISLVDLPDIGLEIADAMLAVLEQIEAAEKRGERFTGHVPTAKEILAHVSERYTDRGKQYLGKLDAKTLKSMLTPEQLKSLRQLELDDLHGSHPLNRAMTQPVAEDGPGWSKQEAQKHGDPFKYLDQKYGARTR